MSKLLACLVAGSILSRGAFAEENRSARKPQVFYLSDMTETEKFAPENYFATKGRHGSTLPNKKGKHFTVSGAKSPNGILLSPPAGGSTWVRYRLGKQYDVFKSDVAIADTPKGGSAAALTFTVLGDGKLLWTSEPLQKSGEKQECVVAVTGVETLQLQVRCPEPNNSYAWSVWIEPRLSRESDAAKPTQKERKAVEEEEEPEVVDPIRDGNLEVSITAIVKDTNANGKAELRVGVLVANRSAKTWFRYKEWGQQMDKVTPPFIGVKQKQFLAQSKSDRLRVLENGRSYFAQLVFACSPEETDVVISLPKEHFGRSGRWEFTIPKNKIIDRIKRTPEQLGEFLPG